MYAGLISCVIVCCQVVSSIRRQVRWHYESVGGVPCVERRATASFPCIQLAPRARDMDSHIDHIDDLTINCQSMKYFFQNQRLDGTALPFKEWVRRLIKGCIHLPLANINFTRNLGNFTRNLGDLSSQKFMDKSWLKLVMELSDS